MLIKDRFCDGDGSLSPFPDRVEKKMPMLLAIWLFLSVLGPHQELYKIFFHLIVIPAVLVLLFSGRLKYIKKDYLFLVLTVFFVYAAITTFMIGLGPLDDHVRALRWTVEATFCLLAFWAWMPVIVKHPYWWAKYLLGITLLAAVAAIIKFGAIDGFQGRLSGFGGLHNQNHTGGVLLVFLAVSHFLLVNTRSLHGKNLLFLGFASMSVVLTVLMSESRSSIGAMVIYFVFLGILGLFTRSSLKHGLLISVAFLIGFAIVFGIYGTENYIEQLLARGTSYRLDIWHGYFNYPPDSWWLGFGLGTEKVLVPAAEEYWKPNNIPAAHPHSIFIGTLVETGIIGVFFLLAMVGVLFNRILSAPAHIKVKFRILGILGLVSVLGFATGQGVISSIKTVWLTVWFPVAFVWFWSQALENVVSHSKVKDGF